MRKLIWPVLFLFLLAVQGAASVFYTGWLAFDLPLVALFNYALLCGINAGTSMGFLVGLAQDAMTLGIFGFHILTRTVLGFCVGDMKDKVFKDSAYYHVVVLGAVCFGIKFFYFLLEFFMTGGQWRILPEFFLDTAGYCLGNMLLAVPMYNGIKFIYDWIRKEDVSY